MTDRDSTPTTRLRARLEEEYGMDEAAILMDRPRGGWDSLVTHDALDDKLARLGAELRTELHVEIAGVNAKIAELRTEIAELRAEIADGFRAQTWRLITALVATVAAFATVAGVAAAIAAAAVT